MIVLDESMMSKSKAVEDKLRELLERSPEGGKLPSVRSLMKRWIVSQGLIDAAVRTLKEEGLLESFPGDGLYKVRASQSSAFSSYRIALLIPNYPSSHFRVLENALLKGISGAGFQFELIRYDYSRGAGEFIKNSMHFDGIVIMPEKQRMQAEYFYSLKQTGLPVFLLCMSLDEMDFDTVNIDNYHGGVLAADHLISLGHRKFAVLAGEPAGPIQTDRIEGFIARAAASGINDVIMLDAATPYGVSSMKTAYDLILQISKESLKFSGLFTVSDGVALGALSALHKNRISVPEALSIVSFDGSPESEFYTPALTTASQCPSLWEKAISDMLIARFSSASASTPLKTVIRPELIVRESTASKS